MRQLVFRDKGAQLFRLLLLDVGLQDLILGVGPLQSVRQSLPVQVQHGQHTVQHQVLLGLEGRLIGRQVRIALLILVFGLVHAGLQVPGRQDQVVDGG